MSAWLDCIPCLVQHGLKAARLATGDPKVHETVLREALCHAGGARFDRPPVLWRWIYRRVRELSGQDDPYLAIKAESTRQALRLYPAYRQRVLAAPHPLAHAVKLAIAANIIDYGANRDFRHDDIPGALEQSLTAPLTGDLDALLAALGRAPRVLYLADNAGELVFDRLLIELLPHLAVTVAVKGGPGLNDALRLDAQASGLDGRCETIDTGTDGTGVILGDCCPEFRRRFAEADLVIAKGQANYETLADCEREVYFLLKVKCPIVGKNIGHDLGDLVVHRHVPAHQPAQLAAPSVCEDSKPVTLTQ